MQQNSKHYFLLTFKVQVGKGEARDNTPFIKLGQALLQEQFTLPGLGYIYPCSPKPGAPTEEYHEGKGLMLAHFSTPDLGANLPDKAEAVRALAQWLEQQGLGLPLVTFSLEEVHKPAANKPRQDADWLVGNQGGHFGL